MKGKPLLNKIVICGLLITIFLIVSNIIYGFFRLGDDTFIYLKYARSIIENGEIAFNVGEPTYGFTSPLWLILLTLTIKIAGNYFVSPHILTLLFSALTIVTWFTLVNNSSLKLSSKLLFLSVVIFDPNLLKHSYYGMEASASFFLSSVLVLILHIHNDKYIRNLLPILFGFYFLIRPESVLISFVVIYVLFAINKITTENIIRMFVISFIVVMPWVAFSWIYFGNILPNTFAAKGADYSWGARFFPHLLDSIKIFIGNYIFIVIAIFLGIIFSRTKDFFENKSVILISILSITILIAFYSLTLNKEFVYARYYCMVFPFIYWIFFSLLQRIENKFKYTHYYLGAIILSSVIIATIFAGLTKNAFRNVELVEDKIVFWVKENTGPYDIIVRGRIGKIGFLCNRKILDPMGIINPEIIKFNKKHNSIEYYLLHKPRYFIGSFNVSELKKYADVKVIKEFTEVRLPLLRNIIQGNNNFIKNSIYKISWY